jgi:hypothetical protein
MKSDEAIIKEFNFRLQFNGKRTFNFFQKALWKMFVEDATV